MLHWSNLDKSQKVSHFSHSEFLKNIIPHIYKIPFRLFLQSFHWIQFNSLSTLFPTFWELQLWQQVACFGFSFFFIVLHFRICRMFCCFYIVFKVGKVLFGIKLFYFLSGICLVFCKGIYYIFLSFHVLELFHPTRSCFSSETFVCDVGLYLFFFRN